MTEQVGRTAAGQHRGRPGLVEGKALTVIRAGRKTVGQQATSPEAKQPA